MSVEEVQITIQEEEAIPEDVEVGIAACWRKTDCLIVVRPGAILISVFSAIAMVVDYNKCEDISLWVFTLVMTIQMLVRLRISHIGFHPMLYGVVGVYQCALGVWGANVMNGADCPSKQYGIVTAATIHIAVTWIAGLLFLSFVCGLRVV